MTVAFINTTLDNTTPDVDRTEFREAMRQLASGVSIIAAGKDNEWTGITATSVSSLSVDPPRILACVNRASSLAPFLHRYWHFTVNFLSSAQHNIAGRFAGRDGIKGRDRFEGANWRIAASGTPILSDALASIDCKLEEVIERHSHLIVIGRPISTQTAGGSDALLYWRSDFARLSSSSPGES